MKIRIKGNSIRLRLTKSEIAEFGREGLVSDSVNFGDQKLIYTLQKTEAKKVDAGFNGEFITVSVPEKIGAQWADTEEVSIEAEKELSGDNRLTILIEKDFQCLQVRPGEDESDMFKNPLAEENKG